MMQIQKKISSHPIIRKIESKMDNLILKVCTKVLFSPIIIFGLYVQFHGDFGPGGGFQAGVIVASSFILYAMVFSLEACKIIMPPKINFFLLVLGSFLYGFVGVISLILGDPYLSYDVLGSTSQSGQHLGILLVEFGVGLTVCNVMISLFYSFANYNFRKNKND